MHAAEPAPVCMIQKPACSSTSSSTGWAGVIQRPACSSTKRALCLFNNLLLQQCCTLLPLLLCCLWLLLLLCCRLLLLCCCWLLLLCCLLQEEAAQKRHQHMRAGSLCRVGVWVGRQRSTGSMPGQQGQCMGATAKWDVALPGGVPPAKAPLPLSLPLCMHAPWCCWHGMAWNGMAEGGCSTAGHSVLPQTAAPLFPQKPPY